MNALRTERHKNRDHVSRIVKTNNRGPAPRPETKTRWGRFRRYSREGGRRVGVEIQMEWKTESGPG